MIKTWWNEREKREQNMLLVLGAVIIAVLIYALIPTATEQPKPVSWQQQQAELKQVALLEQQILGLRRRGAQLKRPVTLVAIQQSLSHAGLDHYVSGTDMGSKTISLQFKSVPFDDLASWLTELTQSTTVHIRHWQSKRRNNHGLVDSQIELTS